MYSDSDDSDKKVDEGPVLPQTNIRFTDMPPELVTKAIVLIDKCMKECKSKFDKEIAIEITRAFSADEELKDETAGWHVIVGKSFASSI